MVPVIGLLLLMIYWGGPSPLRYQKGYPLSFKPAQFTLLLTALGFYLQPMGFFEGGRWMGWRGLSFLLLFPFLLFFPVHYPQEGLGIVYYGIDIIGRRFYSWLSLIGPLYLGLAGGLVLHGIVRRIREFPRPPLEAYVLLFYILLSGFNPYLYERYYYFAWPLVLLLLPRDASENRCLLVLTLSILVAISLVYAKMMLVFPK
jgi:hypothetical protein